MSYPLLDIEAIISRLEERFSHNFLTLSDLPHPYQLKDMQKATLRIVEAIKNREKIVLVGDYDVDGVMATAVVSRFFQEIEYPLETIIPNRFSDGYGLSESVLERVDDADLIFTVDNGIAATKAAKICMERGIDLIITDHHIVPEDPPQAYAIVDQKQEECTFPYDEICGGQIAWYLCAALNSELGSKVEMKRYLDMVAIAIIADMMPLKDINRVMVQVGLQQFGRSEWPFAKAYREVHTKERYSSEDIGFGLAPMINSAGRLEDASVALDFILSNNIYDARVALERLRALNNERKKLEQDVMQEAIKMVDPDTEVIVLCGDGWHEGVVGIVAARIARIYERPAIVLSQKDDICKGSGRSWGDCHLYDLLSKSSSQLTKFGGHKSAIGMSISRDKLEQFVSTLQKDAKELCDSDDLIDPDIIGLLPFGLIDHSLIRLLEKFEPFGQGNPRPKFITKGVKLSSVQTMGAEQNHLRFSFFADNVYLQGVQFRTSDKHTEGAIADIVYTINENHFRGESTVQLMVERVYANHP